MTDPWQDPALPAGVRAADLLARIDHGRESRPALQRLARLNQTPGGDMAPLQHALSEDIDLTRLLRTGSAS